MTDQHRATPEQWSDQQRWARDDADSSCILELRARVEALEKARGPFTVIDTSQWSEEQRRRAMQDLGQPGEFRLLTAEEVAPVVVPATIPADSLVERVAAAIDHANKTGETDARAAIRAVAGWLREQDPEPGPMGRWLGQISTPCSVMADELERKANQ